MVVVGLAKFRDHFAEDVNKYTIIGGTATMLALNNARLPVRATKDLDIVLSLEILDEGFVTRFWDFVTAGGYKQREKAEKVEFYRFFEPTDKSFPHMIEIFSRRPDTLKPRDGQVVGRIPFGEEVGSLSAILLDDDYYNFLLARRITIEDVPVVDSYGLICLKAYAWNQLTAARAAGREIRGDDIKKHANDVLRLYGMISPEERIDAAPRIRQDLAEFLANLDRGKDLGPFNLGTAKVDEVVANLTTIYQLGSAPA
jgi:hypothetical protein